jgi:hypothetical protein
MPALTDPAIRAKEQISKPRGTVQTEIMISPLKTLVILFPNGEYLILS